MPRKKRVSGSKKKPRKVREARTLRSDQVESDKDTDGESSDSSSNTEKMESSTANGAGQPAMKFAPDGAGQTTVKLAPIFEKFMSVKKKTLNVSLESRKPSDSELKVSPMDIKERENVQPESAPKVITIRTSDKEINREVDTSIEGAQDLDVESVRKRLFSNDDGEYREDASPNTLKQDLREMEDRILRNQRESESRIKRANVDAYDQCRVEMRKMIEREEEKIKEEVDKRVALALSAKADKSENEELRRKVARLENTLERVNDNIRIGVEHQIASQFQIDQNKEKIKALEELVTQKDNEIASLTAQSEISDQHTRKQNVWIYGLEGVDKKPEDTLKRVKDFVVNDLKANKDIVQNWDIKHIHRVPTGKKNADPSPIIVSFLKWKDKDHLLRSGKELRGYNEGKRFWVSFKHDLAKGAREARKAMGIDAASIRENEHIMARVCDNAKGQVWLQTKRKREDNWDTIKSYSVY